MIISFFNPSDLIGYVVGTLTNQIHSGMRRGYVKVCGGGTWRGYAEGVRGGGTWRGYVEGVCRGVHGGGTQTEGMQRGYALPIATIGGYAEGVCGGGMRRGYREFEV